MGEFVGLANNTKWSELQQLMSSLGQLAPYWRTRAKNGFTYPPEGWDGDWSYHFRIGEYKHIEWCELLPRDEENSMSFGQIELACKRIGFEVEVHENAIRIIGHRQL